MTIEYVHVGSHADMLASGRPVGPGERLTDADLHDEDQHILEEGRLVRVDSFDAGAPVLTGDELKARAADLDISGRSSMTAEELRTAVAEHENPEQEAPDAA